MPTESLDKMPVPAPAAQDGASNARALSPNESNMEHRSAESVVQEKTSGQVETTAAAPAENSEPTVKSTMTLKDYLTQANRQSSREEAIQNAVMLWNNAPYRKPNLNGGRLIQ